MWSKQSWSRIQILLSSWDVLFLFNQQSLTLIGMSSGNKKNAHLQRQLGANFMRLNELGRVSNESSWCQFSPPKKFGNFWYKFSWQNPIPKLQGVKVPCLMPIRGLMLKKHEMQLCTYIISLVPLCVGYQGFIRR